MAQEKVTTVEDANLVAYLVMQGFVAIPYMKETKDSDQRRVIWDIQGDIEKARQEFYGNAGGIRDFVRSLKEVRQDLYTMKSMVTTNKED
ncbi:MAG: hypothetical protein WC373_15390 [Smithella sp.]